MMKLYTDLLEYSHDVNDVENALNNTFELAGITPSIWALWYRHIVHTLFEFNQKEDTTYLLEDIPNFLLNDDPRLTILEKHTDINMNVRARFGEQYNSLSFADRYEYSRSILDIHNQMMSYLRPDTAAN